MYVVAQYNFNVEWHIVDNIFESDFVKSTHVLALEYI